MYELLDTIELISGDVLQQYVLQRELFRGIPDFALMLKCV